MLICGIDPGFKGAIAFLDPGSRELRIEDMPLAANAAGKEELDLYRLGQILTPPVGEKRLVSLLELVAPMPKQGIASAFRFGDGYGSIKMALVGHGWERHRVTPAKWKRHFRISSEKAVSRSLAAARFPAQAGLFARVKDDGRAEAALLALYALETNL
jgi:crossover junction endodeoxyribonuclease RuvC